jgi:ATP:corrinoid adenosyltransferase
VKQTKRQRKTKVPSRPQVTSRRWSKKTSRIFDKQFDRFLYDELYVPVKKSWGEEIKPYKRNIFGD